MNHVPYITIDHHTSPCFSQPVCTIKEINRSKMKPVHPVSNGYVHVVQNSSSIQHWISIFKLKMGIHLYGFHSFLCRVSVIEKCRPMWMWMWLRLVVTPSPKNAEKIADRAQFGQDLAQESHERHAELQKAAVNMERAEQTFRQYLSYRPNQTGKSRGSRRSYRTLSALSKHSDNKYSSNRPNQTGKSRGSTRSYWNGTIYFMKCAAIAISWGIHFIRWSLIICT